MSHVVDFFNLFFRQEFQKIAERRVVSADTATTIHAQSDTRMMAGCCGETVTTTTSPSFMEPIRLRCNGLRLRKDHGSNWFLYETPVEDCSDQDSMNFKEVIRLIERFNKHVRELKLCQNATLKPFLNNQFAIIILKQEGSGISETKLKHAEGYQCEGVEVSEIRLVRHKLSDKFGNALFEVKVLLEGKGEEIRKCRVL